MEVTIAFLIGAVTGFLLGNSRTRNWLVNIVSRTQQPKKMTKKNQPARSKRQKK